VRDLFAQARRAALDRLVDVIDTIGRPRGAGSFGCVHKREPTLNQILTELEAWR
jgi:cell division protease FtsH